MKNINRTASAMCGKTLLRKSAGVVALAAFVLLISDCSSIKTAGMKHYHSSVTSPTDTEFFLAYDSAVVLDQSEVATITSANGLVIDGIVCSDDNFRSANAASWRKGLVADVLPGVHTVSMTRMGDKSVITKTPIEYNFEAGKIYNFHTEISTASPLFSALSSYGTTGGNLYNVGGVDGGALTIYENKDVEVAAKIAANRKSLVFKPKK